MRLRRAARIDANQTEIVRAVEKAGGLWLALGHPVDGIVGWRGRWFLVEIKDGRKPPSKRRLTEDQVAFARKCLAFSLPLIVAESPEELIARLVVTEGWEARLTGRL
jgi:hypothetical protein